MHTHSHVFCPPLPLMQICECACGVSVAAPGLAIVGGRRRSGGGPTGHPSRSRNGCATATGPATPATTPTAAAAAAIATAAAATAATTATTAAAAAAAAEFVDDVPAAATATTTATADAFRSRIGAFRIHTLSLFSLSLSLSLVIF